MNMQIFDELLKEQTQPKFIRPEILTHPNIPKPLHGLNPRGVLGDEWWDKTRRESYAKNNFCCWACGIHKQDARFHSWIEGHEYYKINYKAGRAKLIEVTALCHSCHNFIHSGRLWKMYQSGKVTQQKYSYIMMRGFEILKENNLKPFYGTAFLWLIYQNKNKNEAIEILTNRGVYSNDSKFAKWQKWHLLLNGKKYYSKFKNYEEWAQHYNKW